MEYNVVNSCGYRLTKFHGVQQAMPLHWVNINFLTKFLFFGFSQSNLNSSWRIKDQLDVTCYFISLLMCSICFGHEYIHHQELATILLNYHIGRIVLGSMCVGVSVWLGWNGIRIAGWSLLKGQVKGICAQHVSDINISIIRSLRLFCWITTLVVLFLVRCVLEQYNQCGNSTE